MMKKSILLLCVAVFAATLTAAPHRLKKPVVFSQCQLKYTLNPNYRPMNYFGNWTDVPLFLDDRLFEAEKRYHAIQIPDLKKMQEIARLYELDGFAFFTFMIKKGTRPDVLMFAARNQVPGFSLFPLVNRSFSPGKDAEQLLKSPVVPRVDGKILLVGHWLTRQFAEPMRKELEKRFPGQFALVVSGHYDREMIADMERNKGKFSPTMKQKIQKQVRDALAFSDGFGWDDLCTLSKERDGLRRFHIDFYRALLAATREVFAEAPHKDKLFLGEALVGHENPSATHCNISSDGTRTLRDTLSAALDAGADLINIPEWDEQNENTSLRPTVANSLSQMRVTRYLIRKSRGEKSFALPGDDLSVPNLSLSMRRVLALGEVLDFELLNIPDSDEAVPVEATLILKDAAGKILHRFAPVGFAGNKLEEHRFKLPSERFAGERMIIPELEVRRGAKKQIFAQGLPIVQLQSTWCWDYKYLKQPLRDLMKQPIIQMSVKPEGDLTRVSAKVEAPQELAFVELLADGDVVYSVSGEDDFNFRDSDRNNVVTLTIQSPLIRKLSGSITLKNAKGKWGQMSRHFRLSGDQLSFRNMPVDCWFNHARVAINPAEAREAVFDVRIPGLFEGEIPVRDILGKQNIILAGSDGVTLRLMRQLQQYGHPKNLRTESASFSVLAPRFQPGTVLQVQLIGSDGKLYRSRPFIADPESLSGKKAKAIVYSATLQKPVEISLPEKLVPHLNYRWNDEYGVMVQAPGWPILSGTRGTYSNLATRRIGGGESSFDGIPFHSGDANFPWQTAKVVVPELSPDGVLKFNGESTFVVLAQGVIPRRSGFSISFKIKPDSVEKQQFILGCRRRYVGSLYEIALLPGGELAGNYVDGDVKVHRCVSGLKLLPRQWNDVRISYDQEHLSFSVNGKTSRKFPAKGPGLFDNVTVIGGWAWHWFKGEIKDFVVSHRR